jgi:hypothetical protein
MLKMKCFANEYLHVLVRCTAGNGIWLLVCEKNDCGTLNVFDTKLHLVAGTVKRG